MPRLRVKASGRVGEILRHDPEDALLTYKLKFLDGSVPETDWFGHSSVEEVFAEEQADIKTEGETVLPAQAIHIRPQRLLLRGASGSLSLNRGGTREERTSSNAEFISPTLFRVLSATPRVASLCRQSTRGLEGVQRPTLTRAITAPGRCVVQGQSSELAPNEIAAIRVIIRVRSAMWEVEVESSMELNTFKECLCNCTGINIDHQQIFYGDQRRLLEENSSLATIGIRNNDTVYVETTQARVLDNLRAERFAVTDSLASRDGVEEYLRILGLSDFVSEREPDKGGSAIRGNEESIRVPSAAVHVFNSLRPHISGEYVLLADEEANGAPLWHKPGDPRQPTQNAGKSHWLYKGNDMCWNIGDESEKEQNFDCSLGWIRYPAACTSSMPDKLIGSWQVFHGDNNAVIDKGAYVGDVAYTPGPIHVLSNSNADSYAFLGEYELAADVYANGYAVWKKRNGDFWIFSGTDARWYVGGPEEKADGFNCSRGLLRYPEQHGGALPHGLTTEVDWEVFKAESDVWQPSGVIVTIDLFQFQSITLRVVCLCNACVDGEYELVKGSFANNAPVWKNKHANYWMYNSVTHGENVWTIGDEDELDAGFATATGFIYCALNSGGRMPHEMPERSWWNPGNNTLDHDIAVRQRVQWDILIAAIRYSETLEQSASATRLLEELCHALPLGERLDVLWECFPRVKPRSIHVHSIDVDRTSIVEHALLCVAETDPMDLRSVLRVNFENESGQDEGGLLKDFFTSFGAAMAEPSHGLWRLTGRGSLRPTADAVVPAISETTGLSTDQLYNACGRIFGVALLQDDPVVTFGIPFAHFFVRLLQGKPPDTLEELQAELNCELGDDETDYRGSPVILERSLTGMALNGRLQLTRTLTDTHKEVELTPGGGDTIVTNENKETWLKLTLQNKLVDSIRSKTHVFQAGVCEILGGNVETNPIFHLLDTDELIELWSGCGLSTQELKLWREKTEIDDDAQDQSTWFFDVLEDFDHTLRGQVLRFATGCTRLPVAGALDYWKFHISAASSGEDSLPTAATCANTLRLPMYSSKELLAEKLRMAAESCSTFEVA